MSNVLDPSRTSLIHLRPCLARLPLARPASAFTLVEVMIVIGIAGLVLAWGIPSVLKMVQRDPIRQATADLVEACSHARARAILAGVPMQLVIRASDGSLSVEQSQQKEGEGLAQFMVAPAEHGSPPSGSHSTEIKPFHAKLHDDIAVELLDVNFRDQMEMPEARVRFHPNGTCDEFTVVIRSTEGEVRKISVDVVTGLADVLIIQ